MEKELKIEENKKYFDLLKNVSPNAFEMLKKGCKPILYTFWCHDEDDIEAFNVFHPNGTCGCIVLDDDNLFDIRCDHLIWMDGMSEWFASPCTMMYGNHEGIMELQMIVWYNEDMEQELRNEQDT